MRAIFILFFMETKEILKEKSFYIWAVVIPILFLFVFSKVGKPPEFQKMEISLNVKKNSETVKTFTRYLRESFNIKKNGEITLFIPEKFLTKKDETVIKLKTPEKISSEKIMFLKINIYRAIAKTIVRENLGIEKPKTFLTLRTKREKLAEIPYGISHSLPATILMFMLFNILIMGTTIQKKYSRLKLNRRFLLTNPGKSGLLLFYIFENTIISMISVTFLYFVAFLFFKFKIGFEKVLLTYLFFFLFSICISSITLLINIFFKREESANGISILLANVLCALGGLWWPIEIVPAYLRKLGLLLPSGIAMNILDEVIFFNSSLSNITFNVLLLLLYTLFFFSMSSIFFFKRVVEG